MTGEPSPRPEPRRDERAARAVQALVFLLCLATYAYSHDEEMATNALAHYDQTVAIVESGTLSMTAVLFTEHGRTGDWSSPDYMRRETLDLRLARTYPAKAPGLSFLAVPPYLVLSKVARASGEDPLAPEVFERNGRALTWLLAALPAAIGAVLLLRLARSLGAGEGAATAGALAIALATSYAPFASVLYAHAPTAAALAASGLLALSGETTARRTAAAGFFAGLATAVSYQSAIAVLALGAAIFARGRRARPLAAYALGGLPWLVFLLAVHQVEFGAPWRTAYAFTNPAFGVWSGSLGWQQSIVRRATALHGLTVSPYRGLFFYSPVVAMAIAAAAVEIARGSRDRQAAAGVALSFLLGSLVVTTALPQWWGGAASGPRYLVPALVFLAPFAAFAWQRWPLATGVSGALSLANALAVTFVSTTVAERVENPLRHAIWPGLLAGKLGRPNLGTALGLEGAASLAPWLLVAAPLVAALVAVLREAGRGKAEPA